MNNYIQRIGFSITFPSGVRMGDGKTRGNLLAQARDGSGQFVLRGTALAGVVRHALEALDPNSKDANQIDSSKTNSLSDWFGSSNDGNDELVPSRIKFADCRLLVGDSSSSGIRIRNHIAIDRHCGAPISGGLYSMESLPPGTSAMLMIAIESKGEESESAKQLLQTIIGLFDQGIVLGGSGARGIGRAVSDGQASWKAWDLSDLEQHADWLDESFRCKCKKESFTGKPLEGRTRDPSTLFIQLELGVPRGQDFLVADGQGIEFDMEPQQVITATGVTKWLLPGATLRGLFRAYITRLAARDGQPVADNYQRWQERNADPKDVRKLTVDDIAYGFNSESDRTAFHNDPQSIQCPVMKLFGSAFAKGRIHIADAVSLLRTDQDRQVRQHVAIDRLSGGANEGFLFDNQTLIRGTFVVNIAVKNPTEEEAKWITQTIRAVDMGLIRVGSSKGAGRLALRQSPTANGPFAEMIKTLDPMEVYCG